MVDSSSSGSRDQGYRVLARKYRPARFEDLIGQEPMVQTLRNAFGIGRIAQAYILTGVRGVGKTTTARILARGLNYETEAGDGAPTVDLPALGIHCQAIMEGRHVDVLEMDAASHNGVGDIRELTDAARYAPVSARYKVYLLDEVHMLSTAAFNALLKTLEEPPDHVKFIFATTEIGKVPVTILSRCQRFDLRRIELPAMVEHLRGIVQAEGAFVDDEALRLIARASEGSVRDALSLLDQAIAHTGTNKGAPVTAQALYELFNLADQATTLDLFEAVMKGEMDAALSRLSDAYGRGTDPTAIIADLAEMVHAATRLKIMPDQPSAFLTADSQARLAPMAQSLPMQVLARAWQMLLKGLDELARAPRPLIAAEMILVRLAYAADLPSPDEALRQLTGSPGASGGTARSNGSVPSGGGSTNAPQASISPVVAAPQPSAPATAQSSAQASTQAKPEHAPERRPETVRLRDLDAVIALAQQNGDVALPHLIRAYVRPVSFGEKSIEIGLADGAPTSFVGDLSEALHRWTGQRWMLSVRSDADTQTLKELEHERLKAARQDARSHPTVQALMAAFPGAEIAEVRPLGRAEQSEADDGADDDAAAPPPGEPTQPEDEESPPWTS
ncbi:MAG: DNA polymerase III subunit gamma/tau [Devosiaceae bacterium]|nr:DNA polymerase III subunit gamma/tau [Devosiaceae bacterium MH13]